MSGGGGGFGGGGGMDRQPPVRQGEELEVTIEAVGEKGDGIARKEGFVLFVPRTKTGQRVRVRVTKVLRTVGFAEVVAQAEGAAQPAQANQPASAPEPEPVQSVEDSEDFGEESPPASGDADDGASDDNAADESDANA